MRIGILTQPLLRNYGAVLQNYALQTVLRRMGHEPITADYVHPYWRDLGIFFMSSVKTVIYKILLRNRTFRPFIPPRRTRGFNRFVRKNISVTKPTTAYSASFIDRHKLNALVVGSDQTWRPIYNNRNRLEAMFLSFAVGRKDLIRVAYAASFGVDTWEYTPEQTERCRTLLQAFDAVSVREPSGVALCSRYLARPDAKHVLDPTLLLTKDDYLRLCGDVDVRALENKMANRRNIRVLSAEPTGKNAGFCVGFILNMTSEKEAFIRRQMKLHGICKAFIVQDSDKAVLTIEEWLTAIGSASLVVTDSFHGTVFSIIFGRNFITIGNEKRGLERVVTLLDAVGLRERLVLTSGLDDFNPGSVVQVDTQQIEQHLAPLRTLSMRFLTDALGTASAE